MNQLTWWPNFFQSLQNLLQTNSEIFVNAGHTEIYWFSGILIAIFVINEVASSHASFESSLVRFAKLLLALSICYAAVMYYMTPIPGIGISAVGIVTQTTHWMSSTISMASSEQIINGLSQWMSAVEVPGFNVMGLLWYGVIWLCVLATEVLAFVVIGFGMIAQAVLVLVGPFFIPFAVTGRSLDWLFWGWLRALVQYSFFQVIAAAVVKIMASLLVPNLGAMGAMSLPNLVANGVGIVVLLVLAIFSIGGIPRITSNLFSGSASGGHGTLAAIALRVL